MHRHESTETLYDVVIVGGGPAGLSAALTLGRSRKRVLLCDSGTPRNAAAEQIHNFVTRDGTPPAEFRRIGRQQLVTYPNVEVRDDRVESISGARDDFQVALASGSVRSRRVLLATGMMDESLPFEGFAEIWGRSIFQCPYCHGWEVRGGRWAYLDYAVDSPRFLPFALQALAWTDDLVVFTAGNTAIPSAIRAQFDRAGIRLETDPIARLIVQEHRLEAVELSTGALVPRDVMFAHPPQHQVALVRSLQVALDHDDYVRVDAMTAETSVSGIYAAGDLATRMQGAVWAAAEGARAAAMMNVDLMLSLAADTAGAST